MTDKSKKTILIAESSATLGKLIQKTLEENGFSTILCQDGFEALKTAINKKPDCLIANKILSTIDGIQICSVLKQGYELTDISCILFSPEENSSDFWTDISLADKVISLSPDNLGDIVNAVSELLNEERVLLSTFNDSDFNEFDEDTLSLCAIKAMEKSGFYSNILKKILDITQYIEDLDELVEHIFQLLYEISLFDAATIILKDTPHYLYSTGTEYLNENSAKTFLNICKADYETQVNSSSSIDYEINFMKGLNFQLENLKNYSSYVMFPIGNNEIIGTIHLASSKKKYFNYKIQSSIQLLTVSLNHIIAEAVKRRKITLSESKLRSTFSKFVPEEIIEDLLSQEDTTNEQSNNEKRKVAVLICDIRNFTSISEINQPENVVGFLNGYFSLMVDIIKKHGGSIDKFIGDAIMALFGAPISYVDNAQRAVEAAMEMVKNLEVVNTSILNFPDGMNFDIGIGIHYGEVIVGNIGSKEKTNYTVIGDSVNLTSRLEGLTKQYGARIIISQDTKDELNEKIYTHLLDKVRVKGKQKGVQIYRVDEKPLPSDFSDNYQKGLNLYMNGAWTLALSYFDKALEILPADKAAKLMKQRCEEFIETPPKDWNGAVALTSK